MNNALVHFLTETIPLSHTLPRTALNLFHKTCFPPSVSGVHIPPPTQGEPYNIYEHIPSYFWLSEPLDRPLPSNRDARRSLIYDLLDLYHPHLCLDGEYHKNISPFCICLFCSRRLDRFHYRECGLFAELSPFGRMKKLKLL